MEKRSFMLSLIYFLYRLLHSRGLSHNLDMDCNIGQMDLGHKIMLEFCTCMDKESHLYIITRQHFLSFMFLKRMLLLLFVSFSPQFSPLQTLMYTSVQFMF